MICEAMNCMRVESARERERKKGKCVRESGSHVTSRSRRGCQELPVKEAVGVGYAREREREIRAAHKEAAGEQPWPAW